MNQPVEWNVIRFFNAAQMGSNLELMVFECHAVISNKDFSALEVSQQSVEPQHVTPNIPICYNLNLF